MRHWCAVLPGRVHEVHYESLVSDQRGTTARLLENCRLHWDDACLAFERNAAAVATASAVQVRQPLYASSVGRWRRCERHLQPLIDELAAAGIEMPGLVTRPTPA
jgi:predicted nuclease with RNAse H fold